jgi:hypothetical protein
MGSVSITFVLSKSGDGACDGDDDDDGDDHESAYVILVSPCPS